MACRLVGANPLSEPIQCWDIAKWTLRNKLQWNFNRYSNIFIQENAFENVVCEMASILSRPQCVKGDTIIGSRDHFYNASRVNDFFFFFKFLISILI